MSKLNYFWMIFNDEKEETLVHKRKSLVEKDTYAKLWA
jgi:hypothetical protein